MTSPGKTLRGVPVAPPLKVVKRSARMAMIIGGMLAVSGLAVRAGGEDLQAAVSLYQNKRVPEAKAAFTEVARRDTKSAEAAYYLGRIALDAQQWDESIQWLGKAAGLADTSSLYHLWLGRAYAQKTLRAGILKRAVLAPSIHKQFERAVELDPESIEARFDLARFYALAPGIVGGSIEKAKQQAGEVMKRNRLQGHQCFAMIYQQQDKPELVVQEYETAVRETPDDPKARLWLGIAYQGHNEFDRAFEAFEALAKAQPPVVGAYYQIGKTAVLSGKNLDRGEESFRLYLQGEPGNGDPPKAWAHFRLGSLYEKEGKKDLARQEYQAALALQADHEEAKKALAHLR